MWDVTSMCFFLRAQYIVSCLASLWHILTQLKAYIKKMTPKYAKCAQLTLHKVAHRIMRAKKTYTIAEKQIPVFLLLLTW